MHICRLLGGYAVLRAHLLLRSKHRFECVNATAGCAPCMLQTPMDTVELLQAIGDDVGFISQVRVAVDLFGKLLAHASCAS